MNLSALFFSSFIKINKFDKKFFEDLIDLANKSINLNL